MAEHFSSARAGAARLVIGASKFRDSRTAHRRRQVLRRAVGSPLRYFTEPLEHRVLLSGYSIDNLPVLAGRTPGTGQLSTAVHNDHIFMTATAVPVGDDSGTSGASGPSDDPQQLVNGAVYRNLSTTGAQNRVMTDDIVGFDDYDSTNNGTINLTAFQFNGGVNAAGQVLDFEWFDTGANFVGAISVQFPNSVKQQWSIGGFPFTFNVPDAGFFQVETDINSFGVTGTWVHTPNSPTIGTQSFSSGTFSNPLVPRTFLFEFTNTIPNQPPSIGSLTDSPDPVAVNSPVTLTANSVTDPEGAGTIANVAFYRESNNLAGLQTGGGGDTLLNTDIASPYSFVASTVGLPAGYYTYYAQATDNAAAVSNAASAVNAIGFGTVSGTKWSDLNSNGVFDGGEPGLANVTVYVDYNDNAALDGGEPSALTAANGTYTINNVNPGTFTVREIVPANSTQTFPGSNGAITEGNDLSGSQVTPTETPTLGRTLYNTPLAVWSEPTTATRENGGVRPIWAPGTPQSAVDDYFAPITAIANSIKTNLDYFTFSDSSRWDKTATNGGGLVQGQSTTLTWRIVNDGTPIPALGGIGGESSAASNLQGFLDGIYGSSAVWLPLFNQIFTSWSGFTGINYVMEAADDGTAFSDVLNDPNKDGKLGVRADMRIGGHFIDGNSNVLAYNFFPTVGEMVIDTGDNFYSNTAGGSLGLRNVLAHEHGHGIGIEHVMPVNETKLMEPFVSFAFDGPQPDDILAANRGYGDRFEKSGGNDTFGVATNLGSLGNGAMSPIQTVSIDDDSDTDFYKFTVVAGKRATVTVTPAGSTYLSGIQGGPAPTNFDSTRQSDLTLQVIGTNGVTVLRSSNVTLAGGSETCFSVPLGAAGTYFIKVTGAQNAAQMYQLDATIADVAGGAHGLIIQPGGTNTNVNFGNHVNVVSGGIAGQVYDDKNGNGVVDGGEPQNGVTVWLDTNLNGVNDDGNAVTTSGSGNFSFSGLAPGSYRLRETVPTDYAGVNPAGGFTDVVVAAAVVNQNLGNFRITYNGTAASDNYIVRLAPGGTQLEILQNAVVTNTIAKASLGASVLTFNGSDGDDSLTADHTNGVPFTAGGGVFNGQNNTDTYNFIGSAGADTVSFNNSIAALVTHSGLEAITFDGKLGSDTVSVTGGPTISVPASQRLASLNMSGGLMILLSDGSRFIDTNSLLISGTGKLDLRDNDLIVRGGNVGVTSSPGVYNGITGLVQSGRNGGTWDGNFGIRTSSFTTTTSIGVATFQQAKNLVNGSDTTTYLGQTVTGTDVLVKYTYGGDATLSGDVNISDYGKIDFNVGLLGTFGWFNGDFNYDGKITISDYGVIDFVIGIQGPQL